MKPILFHPYQWVFGREGGWTFASFFPDVHLPSFCSWVTLANIPASFLPETTDCDGTTGFAAWSRDDFRDGDNGNETTSGEEQLVSRLVSTKEQADEKTGVILVLVDDNLKGNMLTNY